MVTGGGGKDCKISSSKENCVVNPGETKNMGEVISDVDCSLLSLRGPLGRALRG